MRAVILATVISLTATISLAEERFVSIQQVKGNQIVIVAGDSGRGRRGGEAGTRRGRRGGSTPQRSVTIAIPADAKITTAMRERRTFEFRVGAELAGGLRHRIFRDMKQPLSARIVKTGNRIKELNVIAPQIDINQSHTDASGRTVIAVRPKRPPAKKK